MSRGEASPFRSLMGQNEASILSAEKKGDGVPSARSVTPYIRTRPSTATDAPE